MKSDTPDFAATTAEAIEEWFLGRLEEPTIDLAGMADALRDLSTRGSLEAADSCAELLFDRLRRDGLRDPAIVTMEIRAAWREGDAAFRALCERQVSELLAKADPGAAFAAHVGFREGLSLGECFRRLRILLALQPGGACLHKTWGAGTVRRVDDFYAKVVIDFDGKAGHEMSYAYAAESLSIPPADHLLVMRRQRGEELRRLAAERPADVVKLALRSMGPLTAARIQEVLTPDPVPADAWKPFWDSARQALAADPDVDVPSRRTEPLRVHQGKQGPAARWAGRLRAERRVAELVGMLEKLGAEDKAVRADAAVLAAAAERAGFAIRGAGAGEADLAVRAVLAARELGVQPEGVDLGVLADSWAPVEGLADMLNSLPAKLVRPFLDLLRERSPGLASDIVAVLPRLQFSALVETMGFCEESGGAEALAAALRELARTRTASVEIVYWIARNIARAAELGVAEAHDLPFLALEVLQKDYAGDNLRTANNLRALIGQRDWVAETTAPMAELRRRDFLRRVRDPREGRKVDSATIISRMVKLYPELAQELASEPEEAVKRKQTLTSWRSLGQRQRQLRKLVDEDIPRNSRDIAVARSYGDLSENHEYKTAKEMQGILMRRRMEMERELQDVRGTNFDGFHADVAGLGTRVELQRDDGVSAAFCILGAWDSDEPMGIVSCESRLARILDGKGPGARVSIPIEHGEVGARVVSVGPLPQAVKDWIRTPAG